MDNEKISPLASGIIQGLKEAIADANGEPITGTKNLPFFAFSLNRFANNSICLKVNLHELLVFLSELCKVGNKADAKLI